MRRSALPHLQRIKPDVTVVRASIGLDLGLAVNVIEAEAEAEADPETDLSLARRRGSAEAVRMELLGYIAIGLVAGVASGCFGIGGGVLIVPALMLFFKVPYTVAVGTSLALIIPISLAGTLTHHKFGAIDWRIFTACAVAGVIGAIIGALLVQKVPELYAKRGFALFLLYAAWRLWFK